MRRRAPHRRGRASLLLAALALTPACAGSGDEGSGGASTSTTTGDAPVQPRFDDPASGPIELGCNRSTPFRFAVSGVIPGTTRVLLDGAPLTDLSSTSALARLDPTQLILQIHGALVAGRHTVVLANPGADDEDDEPVLSRELEIIVKASVVPVPEVSLAATSIAAADALLDAGISDLGLLAALDLSSDPPRLHIRRREGAGWAAQGPALDLPGYIHDPAALAPAVAARLRPGAAEGDPPRLRVAYRVGHPGVAIDTIDLPWGDSPPAPARALAVPAPVDEPVEWVAYERPHLLDDLLLVEMYAPIDVESPRPGDRRLIALPWPTTGPGAPLTLHGAVQSDLESVGPALDLAAMVDGREPSLIAREGRSHPLRVISHGGLVTLEPIAEPLGLPLDQPLAIAAIHAAFDGSTVLALAPDGAARLLLFDPMASAPPLAVPVVGLPDAAPTGPVAVGLLAGFATFLIPYGDDAVVHAVFSDGQQSRVAPLAGLHCRALAIALDPPGEAAQVALACLGDGELRTGTLSAG